MALEILTPDRLREILDYNPLTGNFFWRMAKGPKKAGSVAGNSDKQGYRCIEINGKVYKAHRLAWLAHYGCWPDGLIDHIDRDKTNNLISNLRIATASMNSRNILRANSQSTTKIRGVTPHGPNYRAIISMGGKLQRLGTYKTIAEAEAVYLAAKKRLHPEAGL